MKCNSRHLKHLIPESWKTRHSGQAIGLMRKTDPVSMPFPLKAYFLPKIWTMASDRLNELEKQREEVMKSKRD